MREEVLLESTFYGKKTTSQGGYTEDYAFEVSEQLEKYGLPQIKIAQIEENISKFIASVSKNLVLSNPESCQYFHVSIANINDGTPRSSVGTVTRSMVYPEEAKQAYQASCTHSSKLV